MNLTKDQKDKMKASLVEATKQRFGLNSFQHRIALASDNLSKFTDEKGECFDLVQIQILGPIIKSHGKNKFVPWDLAIKGRLHN